MSSLYPAAYLMVVLLVDLRIVTHTEHMFSIPVAALNIYCGRAKEISII